VRQTGCPSYVGIATLDFEPLPYGRLGYAFVNGLGVGPTGQHADELGEYVDALNNGIQLRLAGVRLTDLTYFANTTPPAAFAARLDAGIRLGDCVDASCADTPFIAVRVVLRGMKIHEVDSNEVAFRRAGWLGAQQTIDLNSIHHGILDGS
jgi:hypothetical protein